MPGLACASRDSSCHCLEADERPVRRPDVALLLDVLAGVGDLEVVLTRDAAPVVGIAVGVRSSAA